MSKSGNICARLVAGSGNFGMLHFHQLPGNKKRKLLMMIATLYDADRRQAPATRNLHRLILAMVIGLSLMGNSQENAMETDRSPANHAVLPNDQMQISQLSEQERRALLKIKRALREKDERSLSERCVDQEVERLERPPSALEWRVIDLKCRELGGPSVVPDD
tara:strand:- start:743 stop:1231 length:489 start_codon:yes stop_codon:yes gene_type:complete